MKRLLPRLQTRLTVLYAAMFGVVILVMCGLTWAGVAQQARRQVEGTLTATGGVFDRIWRERADRVRSGAEVLARDFGFRAALASHDEPTIISAIDNLRGRLKLDVAFAVDAGGAPLTTQHSDMARIVSTALMRAGDAQGVVMAGGVPYEVVSAPIYAPQLQGWLVFAQRLDATQMRSFAGLSATPLAAEVVHGGPSGWRAGSAARPLPLRLPHGPGRPGVSAGPNGMEFVVLRPLASPEGAEPAALLLRSPKSAAMAPYRTLLLALAGLGVAGMGLVAFGSWALARSITRPIAALAEAAERMGGGVVTHVPVEDTGEVGRLAGGFNAMVDAVAQREAHIRRAALTDSETQLANRQALEAFVARAAAAPARRDGRRLMVAAFGVHQFGRMRGVLGYELAAELLKNLGWRLGAVQPRWRLARTASDTVSAAFLATEEEAPTLVEAARRMLEAATPVGGHLIDVRISTGLSSAVSDQRISDAELALESARRNGAPSARLDPAERLRAAQSLGLMPELRRAIATDALALAHQPKWDIRRGAFTGVESLIRWTHPQRGPIPPDGFITLAEDTGDIRALTDWVVQRAVAEQALLAAEGAELCFSLNLSGRLVGDPAYTRWLLDALSKAKGAVCLEITETAVIGNPEAALATFHAFREAGLKVSIDDYGSGLSSLAYLKQIAADELKLDRSLVCDVAKSARDALLIRSTVDLAHGLGMKVVAEGVEDEVSLGLLSGLGCDLIQGYHTGRPMPLTALRTFLAAGPGRPTAAAAA